MWADHRPSNLIRVMPAKEVDVVAQATAALPVAGRSAMIAEIQCLPSPAGTPDEPYAHIAAAIATVAGSGLHYEVGALGTTLEGPDDLVWAALRAAHEATLATGARSTVSVVKVYSSTGLQPSMDGLVAGYR